MTSRPARPLRRVLIANRGEIAVRVTKTLRRLGLGSVAIYSDADREALHVRMADEAVRVGAAPATQSYLDMAAVIDAARRTDADAIHPGYGFLSENPAFAIACEDAGIVFVGPSPGAIRALGDKQAARRLAQSLGVPVVAGADEVSAETATSVGLPLLLKAAAGGGGRGMRVVHRGEDLAGAIKGASSEAAAAFGDGRIFAERYLEDVRHIEVQVIGDAAGRVQAVGERECSVQRRHQKVVEECPSPSIAGATRGRLQECAVRLAGAAGYSNAGSVEFLYLPASGEIFFLEVNTRLQVEHPVTEEVAGIDLVALQLQAAAGERLPDLGLRAGRHAIEFRVYAEDAVHGFRPSAGALTRYAQPYGEGVRVDSGVDDRSRVPPHYDSLLAKLIVSGSDRAEALSRALPALDAFAVRGPRTNLSLLRGVALSPEFRAGEVSTTWLEACLGDVLPRGATPADLLAAAAAYDASGRWAGNDDDPWLARGSWRPGLAAIRLRDDAGDHEVRLERSAEGWVATTAGGAGLAIEAQAGSFLVNDTPYRVVTAGGAAAVQGNGRSAIIEHATLPPPDAFPPPVRRGGGSVVAPLNAQVDRILVSEGERVEGQQTLLVLSAMKMEHAVVAPSAGVVDHLFVRPGDQVHEGQELLRLRGEEDA